MNAQTTQEQAEMLIVEMDATLQELNRAGTYEQFESCKRQLEGLKNDLLLLGFGVELCVNGWRLVATQTRAAEEQEPFLQEDAEGLYAEVESSKGKTSYTVRVCAKWLKVVSCTCPRGKFGQDCEHAEHVDGKLRDSRPTFSQWIAGEGASQETLNQLLLPPNLRRVAA